MLLSQEYINGVMSYSYVKAGQKFVKTDVAQLETYFKQKGGDCDGWDGCVCKRGVKTGKGAPTVMNFKLYNREHIDDICRDIEPASLMTCDIETDIADTFPDPATAPMPITTIALTDTKLNTIVLGWKGGIDAEKLSSDMRQYLEANDFYKQNANDFKLSIRYVMCDDEADMLEKFFVIASKAHIVAGWNFLSFDWRYITTRIKNCYPNRLSVADASPISQIVSKRTKIDRYSDVSVTLPFPAHVPIIDLMELVDKIDRQIDAKESLALDYIATRAVGAQKVKYDKTLKELYNDDYQRYVFYNAIDSVLLQLIEKKLRCLNILYAYASISGLAIERCLSMVQLTDAIFFDYFYDHGKAVYEPDRRAERDRGSFEGGYVVEPVKGYHKWLTCNDFASLYPSTIQTCNLSFENFIGPVEGREKERLESDPSYFVSVRGIAYKNDQDYSFRNIQKSLKERRNVPKYRAKALDAGILSIIDSIIAGEEWKSSAEEAFGKYADFCAQKFKSGSIADIKAMDETALKELRRKVVSQIADDYSLEQATKLYGNSLYGGSSHPGCYFYNLEVASDITAESRNATHTMERVLTEFWTKEWPAASDLHDMLGVKVSKTLCGRLLRNTQDVVVYGDTDSLYSSYENIIATCEGSDGWSDERTMKFITELNTKYLDAYNKGKLAEYYASRHGRSVHDFELETVAVSGIFVAKKKYMQSLCWKDGKDMLGHEKTKAKGIELIQSSTSRAARDIIGRVVKSLLKGATEPEIRAQLAVDKTEYMNMPLYDICGARKLSPDKYKQYTRLKSDGTTEILLRCPMTVKAVALYNDWVRAHRMEDRYRITNSGKVQWYYAGTVKNTVYVGFPHEDCPDGLVSDVPCNYELQFEKSVLTPLSNITDALGYKLC